MNDPGPMLAAGRHQPDSEPLGPHRDGHVPRIISTNDSPGLTEHIPSLRLEAQKGPRLELVTEQLFILRSNDCSLAHNYGT